ncbi:hypothetical protein MRX96_041159 [Rhipicephalus microplus]
MMIPTVIVTFLILLFTGRSASEDYDCSNAVRCFAKLREQVVEKLYTLSNPEQTPKNLDTYKQFCTVSFRNPSSPCSTFEDYKPCFKRADIEAREKVYTELWNFVCFNKTTWERFMGILYSTTNDPCRGTLNVTEKVLNGDFGKCGTVKELFAECLSQKRLKPDILELSMELLGCTQEQPVSTTTQAAAPPPADPRCDKDGATRCLWVAAKALETSMGFNDDGAQAGKSGCTPASCLDNYLLDGCSHEEIMELSALQRAIENVRSAACGDNQKLLKYIRLAASCWNVEEFKRCVTESPIDLSKALLSTEECSSYISSVHKCIGKSRKQCKHDVKSVSMLPSAFFGAYNCASEQDEIPAEKPKGNNGCPSLASSIPLTVSVALVTALAIRS